MAFQLKSVQVCSTADRLYEWLVGCQEFVERVEWQSSKASQGHAGAQLCERNIKVYPRRYPAGSATDKFLEFEVIAYERFEGTSLPSSASAAGVCHVIGLSC